MIRRTIEQKKIYYSRPGLYRKKLEELESTEEKVIWLLNKYENLRNNDKLLIFAFWLHENKVSFDLDESIIKSLASPETIRRVRQKIQNEYNLYLPTDQEILESRDICEEAVKDWTRRAIEENPVEVLE